MDKQQITEKIQQALKKCSLVNKIPAKDVRVRIGIKKGVIFNDVTCQLLNKTQIVSDLKLAEVLGLNMMQMALVTTHLSTKLSQYAKKEKIEAKNFNARFYTKTEDFKPSVYIFNGESPVREVTVDELV